MSKTEPKQVIVVRKDLGMRKGKIGAQSAHAAMAVILNQMSVNASGTKVTRSLELKKDDPMQMWLEGRFTKICVSVDSEAQLLDVYQQARSAGLPCALITDAGLTEFGGVPTKTCVAIGPAWPEDIDKITGELKLF